MPTRLQLDGEDLAELMRRVRTEMGPNAVVVKAERVRSGGVAGFFAKERFELTVEVPDPQSRLPRRSAVRRPTPAAPSGPAGISALLDAADAAEQHAAGVDAPVPRPGSGPIAVPTPAAAAPRVSTDAQRFASLLASVGDMAEVPPPADLVQPARVRAAEAQPPEVHGVDDAPHAAPGPTLPAARFAPRGAIVTPVTLAPIPTEAFVAALSPLEPDLDIPPIHAFEPEPAPTPAPALAPEPELPRPARPTPRSGGGNRRALRELGVPAALLGDGPPDETLPLSDLLARLARPPALLRASEAIIAVVGESAQALALATQLAERVRQTVHDVVLAGQMPVFAAQGRRLLTPSAAARHRASPADGGQLRIVAVGVGPEREDWPAAQELLAELGPDQTWAAVDARRKPADLHAWLNAVGGKRGFDVVAAAWVHETQEPGTVLGLGVPVGWIDGLPATPVVWAAVLSERLDSDARWD